MGDDLDRIAHALARGLGYYSHIGSESIDHSTVVRRYGFWKQTYIRRYNSSGWHLKNYVTAIFTTTGLVRLDSSPWYELADPKSITKLKCALTVTTYRINGILPINKHTYSLTIEPGELNDNDTRELILVKHRPHHQRLVFYCSQWYWAKGNPKLRKPITITRMCKPATIKLLTT